MADQSTTLSWVASVATGIVLYFDAANEHRLWPEIVAGCAFVVGVVLMALGGWPRVMQWRPTAAVVAISVGILAPVILGGVLAALGIWAGIVATQHLNALPKAESDTLATWIAALIVAVLGVAIFKGLGDPSSRIMPARQTSDAFGRAFEGWFDRQDGEESELAYRAAMEKYVGLDKPINSWNTWARLRRAKVIAAHIRTVGRDKLKKAAEERTPK